METKITYGSSTKLRNSYILQKYLESVGICPETIRAFLSVTGGSVAGKMYDRINLSKKDIIGALFIIFTFVYAGIERDVNLKWITILWIVYSSFSYVVENEILSMEITKNKLDR